MAGYQNRDKLAEMLGGPQPGAATSGQGGMLSGATAGGLVSGGLRDLVERFKQNGQGDVAAESWVGKGPTGSLRVGGGKSEPVRVKTNAGQGSFYRSQHELIGVFRVGRSAHLNNVELGRHGRNRSNVWRYSGVNSFGSSRMAELQLHPTVKPVALVGDAIKDCTSRGDIVLDGFCGSGTTILAAERVGRRGYGLEIDPAYVDATIRRWQAFTGQDAVLALDGRTFNEAAEGSADAAPRRSRSRAGR